MRTFPIDKKNFYHRYTARRALRALQTIVAIFVLLSMCKNLILNTKVFTKINQCTNFLLLYYKQNRRFNSFIIIKIQSFPLIKVYKFKSQAQKNHKSQKEHKKPPRRLIH